MYVYVLFVCLQKRVSAPLELEIHMAVSCPVDTGNRTQIPQKSGPRSLTLMMLALERQGTETSRLSLTWGYTTKPCLKKQKSWATQVMHTFNLSIQGAEGDESLWVSNSLVHSKFQGYRKTQFQKNKIKIKQRADKMAQWVKILSCQTEFSPWNHGRRVNLSCPLTSTCEPWHWCIQTHTPNKWMQFKKKKTLCKRVNEMAQWLRACTTLPENPSFVPSIHVRWL